MRRWVFVVALSLLAGCGGDAAPTPPPVATPTTTTPSSTSSASSSSTSPTTSASTSTNPATTTTAPTSTSTTAAPTTTTTATLPEPVGVIYFDAHDPSNDGVAVWAYDVPSGTFSRLSAAGGDWELGARPSPDGSRVGYWSWDPDSYHDESRVWTVDPDGSTPTQITDFPSQFWGWLPDGSGMVVGSYQAFRRQRGLGAMGDWAVLDFASGSVTLIIDPGDRIAISFDPTPSPDATTIAFDSYDDAVEAVTLMLYDVATFDVTRLTVGYDATWSPDGSALAFYRDGSGLWTIGADGTGERLLLGEPDVSYDYDPAWSPDGAWIAFVRLPHDQATGDIWAIRPDGSGLRRLSTGTPENIANLYWGR